MSRSLGPFLGLVAGDRNGGPMRFAVRLAESLVQRGTFDPDDIWNRYYGWWREGAFDTGATAAAVFRRVEAGESRQAAVLTVHRSFAGRTAGIGPAHRTTPLGALPEVPLSKIPTAARQEARLTHVHPLAGWVSAAVALLVRRLIDGDSWQIALDGAAEMIQGISETDDDEIKAQRQVTQLLQDATGGADSLSERLTRRGFALDAMRAALHFTGEAPSAAEALSTSIRFAGPANYSPVIVGALAGARWESESIPVELLEHEPRMVARFRRLSGGS